MAACGPASRTETRTAVGYAKEIALLPPDTTAGLPVNRALQNRRSWREFGSEPLTLEQLSGVMWAAAGVNRADGHLTAPSALALYPISVYAFFADGVYRYDSGRHRLVRLRDSDYRAATGLQPFVAKAPLNLVYVADTEVYSGRTIPAEHLRYLAGQDAAGYAENVNLYTAGHGMRSVTRGSASDEILDILQLDPGRYFFALAQSVGN